MKSQKDSRSLNALGYIYFKAPDSFERDPEKKFKYGMIVKNIKKSKQFFEKAAAKGNMNALYNLGCLHLSDESN